MRNFIRVMVGVLVFAGCAEEGLPFPKTPAVTAIGEPAGATVTTMIGAAGGTLRSANGDLELIVPAGALSADTAMTVTPLSVTAPGGVKQFRLGPEGTTFSTPATVKMTLTEKEAGGSPKEGWYISFQTPERRWSVIPQSTIENRTVAVQTTHLSDWSLNLGFNLLPPDPTVQVGSTTALTPRLCLFDREDPMSLMLDCHDKGIDKFFVNWSVNGIPGGNSTIGTVQGNAMSRTYTAPMKKPDGPVAVSVEWVPPPEPGGNYKFLLVSNVNVVDWNIRTYEGEISLHLKQGGTGTSILPSEYRVTAPLRFEVASSGNYDLLEGPATLVSFSKKTSADCTCTASNVQGTVQANTRSFVLRDSNVTSLQVTALFPVTLTCTGSNDPSCSTVSDFVIATWALTGQNPDCINTKSTAFTDPAHVNGSWTTMCPVNTTLLGRQEEASWILTGKL